MDTATILIVDDNNGILQLYRELLTVGGRLEVKAARSAAEALDVLAHSTPDLLILDEMMPHMSGSELCQKIRARADLAETPIIMLSASTSAETMQNALAAGVDNYLTKSQSNIFNLRKTVNAMLSDAALSSR